MFIYFSDWLSGLFEENRWNGHLYQGYKYRFRKAKTDSMTSSFAWHPRIRPKSVVAFPDEHLSQFNTAIWMNEEKWLIFWPPTRPIKLGYSYLTDSPMDGIPFSGTAKPEFCFHQSLPMLNQGFELRIFTWKASTLPTALILTERGHPVQLVQMAGSSVW